MVLRGHLKKELGPFYENPDNIIVRPSILDQWVQVIGLILSVFLMVFVSNAVALHPY